jgi:hypothetical protein
MPNDLVLIPSAIRANVFTVEQAKDLEDKFVKAMGSPETASKAIGELFEYAASGQRDVRNLTNAVRRLEKKGDKHGASAVKRIARHVFIGAKWKENKDKSGHHFDIKGCKTDRAALSRLIDASTEGLSIRDTLVKRVSGEKVVAKTDADKLAKTYVNGVHKRVENEACSLLDNVIALRAALKVLEAELASQTQQVCAA